MRSKRRWAERSRSSSPLRYGSYVLIGAVALVASAALHAQVDILDEPGYQAPGNDAPGRHAHTSVLVHFAPGSDRGALHRFMARNGGVVKYEYQLLPGVVNVRRIPEQALAGLQNVPGVLRVEEDGEVHAHMDDSVPLIGALQSQITSAGYTADGAGVRVCIVDTGIQSGRSLYADRIDTAAGRDFVNGDNDPEDDHKHGTHVAGIAAGGTGTSIDANGCGARPFQGVAPEATLIGVKVLGANGSGNFSDVIAGIDYCADQSPTGGRADVINMSLGGGSSFGPCDNDSAAVAANAAVDAGVVVVVSAGNNAYDGALTVPACASKSIAVGATYDSDYPNCQHPDREGFSFCTSALFGTCLARCEDDFPLLDQRTCFSNSTDQLDVVAPGCITLSADFGNPPDGLIGYCGTSMAAPHVAGLAALLLSENPSLTPAQVRQAIRIGAVDIGEPGFDPEFGYGRIDALNSLSLLGAECAHDGHCDDGDGCTMDTCADGSCTHTTLDCDDGDPCTLDGCSGGTCTHLADCNDGDPCTVDTCDVVTGCLNAPLDCDDGLACTTDTCVDGNCSNIAVECDDGNPCTVDGCDGLGGCTYAPVDCEDGNPCTTDFCAGGVCWHNLNFCDDGDECTDDRCDSQVGCVHEPTDCDDADLCTIDTCDTATGCLYSPIDCDDGDPCTFDSCTDGVCSHAGGCDDGDPCTVDTCDAVGCINTEMNCDDGDVCTTDTCSDGICVHKPDACSDGDPCTVDTCGPGGVCSYSPVDCDDGTACTNDICAGGVCWHFPLICDDGNTCTVDSCDPAVGCVNTPTDCDDGDACTTDTCDAPGECLYTPVDCDDADACTVDSCDPVSGCVNTPAGCDDGDACTVDTCDPVNGCSSTPVDCDDADACTVDSCDPVSGCVNTPAGCDDADVCTSDSCVGGSCVNTPISCDDGNACTADACNPASGCSNAPVDCDDGDPCTVDSCDWISGCTNDAVVCPPGETCVDGVCTPPACNDNGVCEVGEDCNTCPADCPSGPQPGYCGDGVCQPFIGEDCVSCAADCAGKQGGKLSKRFCCGDGEGDGPVGCTDTRCNAGGFVCNEVPADPYCCGDGVCDTGEDGFDCEVDCGVPEYCGDGSCNAIEDSCDCPEDCGSPPAFETSCTDGQDNDCDALVDCADTDDCGTDPACSCLPKNASCASDGECCSGTCKSVGRCR